jgi:hypothetical protein
VYIQLNPDANIDILMPGLERTPVIVMDNLATDLQPLLETAQQQEFTSPAQAAYPGVRAPLPHEYTKTLLQAIYSLITDLYKIPKHLQLYPQNQYYSLVSTAPEELARLQRVPHFDSLSPYYFAIMHYLAPGPRGGTGFFRHEPSGFENINASRFETFKASAEAYMAEHGEPPPRYQTESDQHFAVTETVSYQQNRLMIYPGTLLHSGLIEPDTDIDANPQTGRLTANLFIEFK